MTEQKLPDSASQLCKYYDWSSTESPMHSLAYCHLFPFPLCRAAELNQVYGRWIDQVSGNDLSKNQNQHVQFRSGRARVALSPSFVANSA